MANLVRFPDRSKGFVSDRLVEARQSLQMSRAELARELNMSGQAIGFYETGERRPDMATLLNIATVLKQPVAFFLRESSNNGYKRHTRFFRSVGSRANKVNHALDVKTKWLWEIVNTVAEEVRLPDCSLPVIDLPADKKQYTPEEIEGIAIAVRRHWGLGDGPIANVIALFETHGIIVTRMSLGDEDIDAFSCWIGKRPFIFLGSDKSSSSRSRFDAAHELGHLLLHNDIEQADLENIDNKELRQRIEHEAHLFSGAFHLPRSSMLKEFYSPRLNHLEGMKTRWKISMQAIAHRARQIGILDEYQYILFRKQISARKFNKKEPLDDVIKIEQPQWLVKCWNVFAQKRGITHGGVEEETGFSLSQVLSLLGRPDLQPIAEKHGNDNAPRSDI